jgi:hypothetical protein
MDQGARTERRKCTSPGRRPTRAPIGSNGRFAAPPGSATAPRLRQQGRSQTGLNHLGRHQRHAYGAMHRSKSGRPRRRNADRTVRIPTGSRPGRLPAATAARMPSTVPAQDHAIDPFNGRRVNALHRWHLISTPNVKNARLDTGFPSRQSQRGHHDRAAEVSGNRYPGVAEPVDTGCETVDKCGMQSIGPEPGADRRGPTSCGTSA